MCFKNLIGIYAKELKSRCERFGVGEYYKNNANYVRNRYLECQLNMEELINSLKQNCDNLWLEKRSRNSDKLFVDLYHEFNK